MTDPQESLPVHRSDCEADGAMHGPCTWCDSECSHRERAAIVAWLRFRASLPGVKAHQPSKSEEMFDTADRIERGEHHHDH